MLNLISTVELFDVLFIISMCLIPALLYVMIAGVRVNSTFRKYNGYSTVSGLTAEQAARKILDNAGLYHVNIAGTSGRLTDHYDPRANTIYLSEATRRSSSIAAIGVAAHEVGHAIQYAKNYIPVKMRTAIVPIVNFTSRFSMPLLLIAMLLEIFLGISNPASNIFLAIAIAFYGCYLLFTLITLPVEYNASHRAKQELIACDIMTADEVKGASRVLSAAAQTYLASFLFSLAQFARMLIMLLSRRNNNNHN